MIFIFFKKHKTLTIYLYSFFGTLSAIIIYFFLPETNSRNLIETIEELENDNQLQAEVQPLQSDKSLATNEFEKKE